MFDDHASAFPDPLELLDRLTWWGGGDSKTVDERRRPAWRR
jgi:hypothetical protein